MGTWGWACAHLADPGPRLRPPCPRQYRPSALSLPLSPPPWMWDVRGPGGALNLTSSANSRQSEGFCRLPFKLPTPDLPISLSACTCVGQGQGARKAGAEYVCLVCLARLCVEKVTKQMGQASALSWGHCCADIESCASWMPSGGPSFLDSVPLAQLIFEPQCKAVLPP